MPISLKTSLGLNEIGKAYAKDADKLTPLQSIGFKSQNGVIVPVWQNRLVIMENNVFAPGYKLNALQLEWYGTVTSNYVQARSSTTPSTEYHITSAYIPLPLDKFNKLTIRYSTNAWSSVAGIPYFARFAIRPSTVSLPYGEPSAYNALNNGAYHTGGARAGGQSNVTQTFDISNIKNAGVIEFGCMTYGGTSPALSSTITINDLILE